MDKERATGKQERRTTSDAGPISGRVACCGMRVTALHVHSITHQHPLKDHGRAATCPLVGSTTTARNGPRSLARASIGAVCMEPFARSVATHSMSHCTENTHIHARTHMRCQVLRGCTLQQHWINLTLSLVRAPLPCFLHPPTGPSPALPLREQVSACTAPQAQPNPAHQQQKQRAQVSGKGPCRAGRRAAPEASVSTPFPRGQGRRRRR